MAAMVLVVAACAGDSSADTTASLPPASTIGQTTTIETPDTTTTVPSSTTTDKSSVVQEFVDRRSDGRIVESMELTTTGVSETFIERIKGLAAWNFRSEQAGPCEESPEGTFHCPMLEYTDFHTIAGISPWTNEMVVTVNDEGIITATSHNLVELAEIRRFNSDFQLWLRSAHPEEADRMNGTVMTLLFTEDDALTALEFVEEFVAFQSEG